MHRSTWCLWSVTVALLGCQTGEDAKKSSATAGEAGKSAGAPAVDPNAAGAGSTAVATITECPRSLGGADKQHRVISSDCGVVEVTEDLAIDGGSLTLEAGAQLAFKDGAGLVVGYHEPAKLIIKGTAEAPVVFTAAGDKAAGVWKGVALREHAARSELRGLVIEFAGANDEPALRVDAKEVVVEKSSVRSSKIGVVVAGEGGFASFTGNEFKRLGRAAAIELPPGAVGGLGAGNRFDGDAYVHVLGGPVRRSARWQVVGAPLVIAEDVGVDGDANQKTTLELAAGLELRFSATGSLSVGYYDVAALVAKGSADAKITFTAQDKRQRGGWHGIRVHEKGEAAIEHAVLEFGGADDAGVIDVRSGSLALTHSTLRSDAIGVVANATSKITAFADNTFVATPIAVQVPAGLAGSLGEGNAYDKDAKIKIGGDTVKGQQVWHVQGVPLELTGGVGVEGELTLDAGLALLAASDAGFTVGYYEAGSLIIKGTAAAPVTIGPVDVAKGAWPGVVMHEKSSGNAFDYLVLTGAANERAIDVKAGSNAVLNNVTCARCSGAVVGWDCGARVTSSQVLAADGTPRIDAKPEGC